MKPFLWEFQYRRQFEWLKNTRDFLYGKVRLGLQKRVLEPGCSIALITEELSEKIDGMVVGLDKDFNALFSAKKRGKKLSLVCGDVYYLPFKKETFDSVVFQFFLLWVKDSLSAFEEMKRVVIPTGWIISTAEPDYGGRIDFPHTINYSSFIVKSLLEEGADPFVGRKLEYIYRKSSLVNIQWGLTSVPFGIELAGKNFEKEWSFIEKLAKSEISAKLKRMKTMERKFLKEGKRSYFMPVFYCIGRKKMT